MKQQGKPQSLPLCWPTLGGYMDLPSLRLNPARGWAGQLLTTGENHIRLHLWDCFPRHIWIP